MTEMSGESEAFGRLRHAAAQAVGMVQRVGGSVLQDVADGSLDGRISVTEADDLADSIRAGSEHVRFVRAQLGEAAGDPSAIESTDRPVVQMLDTGLPLNRKERFYTATVLPMLIASDGFAHLNRFLRLCGIEGATGVDGGRDGRQALQFFTEYSFAESVFTPQERERFTGRPESGDVPDLLLAGEDWLLAVEAKMFHKPTVAALNGQVARQRTLVDYLARTLGVEPARTRHVLLLPAGLPAESAQAPVALWQEVLDAYEMVAPPYWVAVLRAALDGYDDRVSRGPEFGANRDSRMTGSEILAADQAGDTTYSYMGRSQGLSGRELASDIASGAWRTRPYEVRADPIKARNWFAVAAFVELVSQS